jgi:hypothetical protein
MRRNLFVLLFGLTVVFGFLNSSSIYSGMGKYVVMLDLIQNADENNPSTNVGFFIDGWAGRYAGYDMWGQADEIEKSEYRSYGIPKNADAACHAFWAGMGETVYLVQKNDNVEFYSRNEYEDGKPTKYKKVKTVKLK